MRMAQEAIVMVSSGATKRVVIAGIRHGDAILEEARRIGLEAGVRVNALRQSEPIASELVIELITE